MYTCFICDKETSRWDGYCGESCKEISESREQADQLQHIVMGLERDIDLIDRENEKQVRQINDLNIRLSVLERALDTLTSKIRILT